RELTYSKSGNLFEKEVFDQFYQKGNAQLTKLWNIKNISTLGLGVNRQSITADRFPDTPVFYNYFFYGQHEWMPLKKLDLIAGFRYDVHTEYGSQLSPKLSARYKVSDWLHLRASAGSGFKAPNFDQLYLNFMNPTVG